jgi:outer membrane protein TolC
MEKVINMLPSVKTFTWPLLAVGLLLIALPTGGAQVDPTRVQNIKPNRDSAAPLSRSGAAYTVQVAAFQKLFRAKDEVARLLAKGYDPFYRYEDTGTKGMWYRVYADRYATRQEALDAGAQMKRMSLIDWFMVRQIADHGDDQMVVATPKSKPSPTDPPSRGVAETQTVQPPLTAQTAKAPTPSTAADTTTAPLMRSDVVKAPTAIRLSLLDALRFSLEGNQEIKVVSYTPRQSREVLAGAEAVYDPFLFFDSSYRRDANLESSVADIVTEDFLQTQTGIRKPLKTGGSLSTYLETRYSDLNNATFSRTFKHIVAPTVEMRQPLLNNIGAKKEQTAIKIANYKANISDEEFRETVIEVTNRVAKVYWQLYLFKEVIGINRKNLDMAEEVYRREAERLERGITQPLDVERARSNAESRRSTLLKSLEEYRVAMDRLKLLLNRGQIRLDADYEVIPIDTPRTEPLVVNETEIIATALKNRSEIVKVLQEKLIRQADEELAAHQRLPELDAFGRYSLSGYGDDFNGATDDIGFNDDDGWEVGLVFKWAIGNRAANSRHRETILKRRQVDALVERLENDIKLDIKQILHGIETARGEIAATRIAKAAAKKVVEGEFTRFDIGQTTNEELLRAQDLLALTSRSHSRAVVNYNIALHELSRAQGILPDGVTIDQARR